MDPAPAAAEPPAAAAATEGSDDSDGDAPVFSSLPEFSDDDAPPPAKAKAPVASSSRAIPGRKKLPLSQLKRKLTGTGGGGGADKKEPKAAKAINLSEDQLDDVMRQLIIEQGPEAANIDRSAVLDMIRNVGISKDFLQGKVGLMGKGTKEAGSVTSPCRRQPHQEETKY